MANVQMQARSDSDGALYTWSTSAPDWDALGFPGPGNAEDVAVSMRPSLQPHETLPQPANPADDYVTLYGKGGNHLLRPSGHVNVTVHGASPSASAATNTAAIQAAIDAVEAMPGGGVVMFPGSKGDAYEVNAQLTVTASNVKFLFPGGASLRWTSAVAVWIAVGDIDGLVTDEENFLASNADAGTDTITLAAGKGANFVAGGWYLMHSEGIVPDHHSAVVVTRAEWINIAPDGVTGDVLTLSRRLRYSYTTADNAQVYRPPLIHGFEIDGMTIDGNDQIANSLAILASWCFKPVFKNITITSAQQRGIRLQGTFGATVDKYSQSDGLSSGFQGDSGHFSYCISEGGPCEGTKITNMVIDRCRHAYTTSGIVSNSGTSSPLNSPGFGVPTGWLVKGAHHTNARGAGFDTHETGIDGTFEDCHTIGGLQVGFQDRAVRTKWVNCSAVDCVGAAFQFGADAQYPQLLNFKHSGCNRGTDDLGNDWTKFGPLANNSGSAILGPAAPNLTDNGNFDVWDNGTTFSATGAIASRWRMTLGSGATAAVTRETTSLTDPLPFSGQRFARLTRTVTGAAATSISQHHYTLRETAGQKIVVSFDMRSDTGEEIQVGATQYFGTGGGASANVEITAQTRTIDAAFRRYTVVFDIPTIAGKTIGTSGDEALIIYWSLPTSEGNCFIDLKRVKTEQGMVPTAFMPESRAETDARCAKEWRLRRIVDTLSDGSTDETVAIQGAIDAAGDAGGGEVWIRPGVTRITTLTIGDPDVTLRGMPGAILETTNTDSQIINVTGARSGIRGLHIRTTGTATDGSHFFGDADDVFAEDCVSEAGGGGFRVRNGANQRIENNRVINSVAVGTASIQVGAGSGNTSVAPIIRGNVIESSASAVVLVDCTDALFEGNQIRDSGSDAVVLQVDAARTRILGNLIAGAADDGLVIANNVAGLVIDGNTFQGNADRAIVFGTGITGLEQGANTFIGNGDDSQVGTVTEIVCEDDFTQISTAYDGLDALNSGTAGAGVSVGAATVDRPGIHIFTTGTDAAGWAGAFAGTQSILFGGGKQRTRFDFLIPTLSDGVDGFTVYAGFIDSAGAVADGAYVRYEDSLISGDFQYLTVSNSSETTGDSNIAVAATTWYTVEVEVNAAANSVTWWIQGSDFGPITTTIPTGAGRETGFGIYIRKTSGTTARTLWVDYAKWKFNPTTPR